MRPFGLTLLLSAASTTLALTLSQFQPIVSFPSTCTTAYNLQIPSCTTNDFTNGQACSQACISALTTISQELNTACTGSRADPQTLIGLFFEGKGVATLCPNAAGLSLVASSVQSTVIIGQSSLIESTFTSVPTSIVVATSYATSSTVSPAPAAVSSNSISSTMSISSSPASQASPQSSSIANAAQSSTATSSFTTSTLTSSSSTTVKASQSSKIDNSGNTSLRGGFSTTAVNNGQATVLTSQAQRTDSSNPDAFGGGGSPFEVGDNSAVALGLNFARLLAVSVGTAAYIIFAGR